MVDNYKLMKLAVWAKCPEFNTKINSGLGSADWPEMYALLFDGSHFKFFTSPPIATLSIKNAEELRTFINPEYLELFDLALSELSMRCV
jgi:hypothetical protein